MSFPNSVVNALRSMPEVTKPEALQHALVLCDRAEDGDREAIACLAQLAGFVAMCDHPEFIRRFIVHLAENGCAES